MGASRTIRESDAIRGVAKPLPGISSDPVHLPRSYWGDRQRESVDELLTLLPIINVVVSAVPLPDVPSDLDSEESSLFLLNSRLTTLLQAKQLVADRLRKEL